MNENGRDQYIKRLENAWKDPDGEDIDPDSVVDGLLPEGARLSVNMLAMDSVQRSISTQTPDANKVAMDEFQAELQAESDRIAGFEDHFAQEMKKREAAEYAENPSRVEWIKRTTNAWRNP